MLTKIKEIFNKDNIKKILILGLLVFAVIFMIVFMIKKFNTDGMEQTKGVTVYYRTYTKEHGWSRWSKNGVTSGNKKDDILNIEVKVKSKTNGDISYRIYNSDGKWQKNKTFGSKTKTEEIQGLKLTLIGTLSRKYDVLYRFYVNGKWTNWYSNGYNKEIKKTIKAIDIKLLPKDANLNKYLRDYNYTQKKKGEK